MKNICFLNSIKFWGGGEKLHLENAIEFNKKDYNVTVAANPGSILWQKSLAHNLKLSPISVGNLSYVNPFKVLRFTTFLKKNKIDTLVFSSSQDLKIGAISGKLAGVKRIVYLRGLATPVKANFINKFIFKSCLTHIIANSDETKRQILKYLNTHISNDKVHTIYHGIELNEKNTDKLEIVTKKASGIVIGNAGRLTEQKRQKDLIQIARKLVERNIDFTLFIAGEGELREELESEIVKYNLQNKVILLGFVEDMSAFMSSIDVFVLTSEWEGFGFVLVEAMMKSKPVLAYDITSNPEIIDDHVTGYLIDFPKVEMFAEKIELLSSNPDIRKQMGEAGLKRVKDKFILQDRIDELEAYLIENDIN
ncbi:MAG: glycosyltransferase family 1 protein [Ignavibacteriae bacterium HGW-Ignavibacteriae-4]|jgi:glycosyltransferase involved in cell wall biosynthesis|nr:MAG: glycosyltransferase family 1 protein [Ignavibacteriae bacterium HGW-Ignavibacteriae-4]